MSKRIRVGDWEAVVGELRRFGETGDVATEDDRVRIDFGAAHVEVSRHGHVSTGMALHDFERESTDEIVVDHEAGTLRVDADDVTYTFRRPGG